MKLLGWNCNGAFRRKYQALENFNADIWVVPESESPAYLLRHKSPLSSAQQLWCGQNQSKGLSVFAFNGCQISRADFFNPAYRHILPVNITTADKQKMLLIAVWASRVKDNSDWDYIGQLCHFMEHNGPLLPPQSLFLGDFNINMQWNDSFKKEHNYSRFLELCHTYGFTSLYHHLTGETQGQETTFTSYSHRIKRRGYHIDYAWLGRGLLRRAEAFRIHGGREWLTRSDHMVLEVELGEDKERAALRETVSGEAFFAAGG